jgi:hypothetical protein
MLVLRAERRGESLLGVVVGQVEARGMRRVRLACGGAGGKNGRIGGQA